MFNFNDFVDTTFYSFVTRLQDQEILIVMILLFLCNTTSIVKFYKALESSLKTIKKLSLFQRNYFLKSTIILSLKRVKLSKLKISTMFEIIKTIFLYKSRIIFLMYFLMFNEKCRD